MRIDYLVLDATAGGGIVRTLFTMSQALAERGHQVRVVSLLAGRPAPSFVPPPDVELQTLLPRQAGVAEAWPAPGPTLAAAARAVARRRTSTLVGPHDHQAWRYSRATDDALRSHLAGTDAQVVLGTRSGINLALAGIETRALRVAQEHVGLHLADRALRETYRARLPGLDAVVTLTGADATRYRRLLGDTVPVRVVPNAVDPAPGIHLADPGAGPHVVIAAGRLARQKGFDLLVEAWRPVARAHPDWQLHVYGRGPQAAALVEQVEAAGLSDHVRFRGFDPDLGARWREASAFVLSSRFEGMPMVVLEAMAAGLPVVAFDCPTGPRQLLGRGGETGVLVPAGSVPALSAALVDLLGDPGRRRLLAAAGHARVDRFSVERVAERWESLLGTLLDGAGSGRSRARVRTSS